MDARTCWLLIVMLALTGCAQSHIPPVRLVVSDLEVDGWMSLVRLDGGEVRAWGDPWPSHPSLTRLVPETVVGLTSGVRSAETFGGTICALMDTGTCRCVAPIGDEPERFALRVVEEPSFEGALALVGGSTNPMVRMPNGEMRARQRGGLVVLPRPWGEIVAVGGGDVLLIEGGLVGAIEWSRISESQSPTIWMYDWVLPETSVGLAEDTYAGCALLSDRTLRCWTDFETEPYDDPGLTDIVEIHHGSGLTRTSGHDEPLPRAGYSPYCARSSTGTVWCWGSNGCDAHDPVIYGDPLPTVPNDCVHEVSSTPTLVPLPAPAVRIGTGARHACALLSDGDVYCWGGNERGQLGDGTRTDSPTPVRVLELR